jgi:hypothetical protein
MTRLLRDVIEIPDAVQKGDFVMSLADGVAHGHETLEQYVVTPQLASAFDNALGFIASALREDSSKAAYLDGSFGSGKSHFMAVLHLLLQQDPEARAMPELAETIAKHDAVLKPRSFELVPFHMIGAESMEQAVFGGYVEHLRQVDPSAPPPGVYADAPLFEQAEMRRAELGDEVFFGRLNERAEGGEEGWGDLAAPWSAETYERARQAPVGDPDRGRLGGAIVATLLPGFREAMRGAATGYVDFDTGLAELARHAHDRGSDALILFLDELILWLGSRIADEAFVAREGQKLIKLIEFTTPRPIPIISFVARQRDLRDFVGDEILGAEKLSFADALKHWNDRFHRIELDDRNLPKIAERRLLRPRDEASKQELDEAFRETERARPEVLDVLMTEDGDRELFRSTYPFSPAFMKTLIAASSVLQRERTALRVMLQLLVDRRDELEVGDLVSVGELFDVLAHGDEPFTEDMKRLFDYARELYLNQFRPLLIAESNGSTGPLPADERLVKTLLLAALVPQTGPLRNLDVAKLTALNHGSIASPLPGQDKAIVLSKLRKWHSQIAALKVGEDPQNPSVEVRLTGIDVDSIISRAEAVDNAGERRLLVKQLVLSELGIDADTRLFSEHVLVWRGTRRTVEVVFGNVRDTADLPDDMLRATGDRWKVVVDYPFDPGHSPLEDLDRLERWRQDHDEARTVCWIPAFFSQELQRDVKRLVIVGHILGGERLEQYADHLSPQDRQQARGILSDLRSALDQRVRTAIRQAYGVERSSPDAIDPAHEIGDRLQSLWHGFSPQVPVGAHLSEALAGLLDQMLAAQYPDHPRFETEIRARDLRDVMEEIHRAVEAPDGRIEVPKDRRKTMRQIATPLQLGIQHEAPFVLGTHWKDHLDKAVARAIQSGNDRITVRDVRQWIEQPKPLGLTRDVQSLVILAYAAQSGRSLQLHGGPAQPSVEKLDDELELITAELPDEPAWRTAVERAASILGLASVNPAHNPAAFERLVSQLRERGTALLPTAQRLIPLLEQRLNGLGADPEQASRMRTAIAASDVTHVLVDGAESAKVIERFAAIEIPTSEQAVGTSLSSAAPVLAALEDSRWQMLDLVAERAKAGDVAHQRVVGELVRALNRDEFAESLAPALERAANDAIALLREEVPPKPPPKPSPPPPGAQVGEAHGLDLEEARRTLDQLASKPGEVRVDLSWTVVADGRK